MWHVEIWMSSLMQSHSSQFNGILPKCSAAHGNVPYCNASGQLFYSVSPKGQYVCEQCRDSYIPFQICERSLAVSNHITYYVH